MEIDPFFKYLQKSLLVTNELYKDNLTVKKYSRFKSIELPSPSELKVTFSEAIKSRASIRAYNNRPISLEVLSNLLFWTLGQSGKKDGNGKKRAYPSGGAKYPIEAYLFFLNKKDPLYGVYHYNVMNHKLEKLSYVNVDFDKNIIAAEDYAQKSAVLFAFSYKKSRSFGKYGNLAYKLALMEVGAINQNIYLVANSLGLGCCALGRGSRFDREAEDLLKCDVDETIVLRLAVGCL